MTKLVEQLSNTPTAEEDVVADALHAEACALDWLRRLGDSEVMSTSEGADGGVDARSRESVAQVKHWSRPVGIKPLRELFGVAATEKRRPVFFAASGYTRAALEFAEEHAMLVFVYHRPLHIVGATQLSREVLELAAPRSPYYAARDKRRVAKLERRLAKAEMIEAEVRARFKGITKRHPVMGVSKRERAQMKLALAREIRVSVLNDALSLQEKERLVRKMASQVNVAAKAVGVARRIR